MRSGRGERSDAADVLAAALSRTRVAGLLLVLVTGIVVLSWLALGTASRKPHDEFVSTRPVIEPLTGGAEHEAPGVAAVASSTGSLRPEGSATAMIRVVSATGAPVADAEVLEAANASTDSVARTDANGMANVSLDARVTAILARHPDYAPASLSLQGPRPARCVITLSERGVIRGVVLDAGDGGRPLTGVLVRAWRARCSPGAGSLDAQSPESILGAETVSGPGGSFVLDGLAAQADYDVIGYGQGLISRSVRASAGEDVVVSMLEIYGTVLRIRDDHGDELQQDPRLLGPGSVDEPLGAFYLNPERQDLALSSIPSDVLGPIDLRHWLVLYAVGARADSIGPVNVVVGAPGYESQTALVPLPPVAGGLPVSEFALKRWADGFGTVEVEIVDPSAAPLVTGSGRAWVRLLPAEVSKASPSGFRFSVDHWGDGPVVIHGVPFGRYVSHVESLDGASWRAAVAESPSGSRQEVEVGEETVRLKLDASDLAGMEAIVLDAQGNPWDRVLTLALSYDGAPYPLRLTFTRAPYQVSFLPAGHCRVEVEDPFPGSLLNSAEGIDLRAGKVTSVELAADDLQASMSKAASAGR